MVVYNRIHKMKKIILFSGIIAMAFTACKKEEAVKPLSPATSAPTENRLTGQANQGNTSNGTAKTTHVSIVPGVYVYTTDVTQGTCFSSNNACFVVVSALGTGTTTITSNYSNTYPPNTAQATVYTNPSQQFYITSLNVTFNGANADVKMVRQ